MGSELGPDDDMANLDVADEIEVDYHRWPDAGVGQEAFARVVDEIRHLVIFCADRTAGCIRSQACVAKIQEHHSCV